MRQFNDLLTPESCVFALQCQLLLMQLFLKLIMLVLQLAKVLYPVPQWLWKRLNIPAWLAKHAVQLTLTACTKVLVML